MLVEKKKCTGPMVWIDLEMTGLSVNKEVIIEIATLVTDSNLNLIAQGPDIVIHQPEAKLFTMDEWNSTTHTKSGLLDKVRASRITLAQAEKKTLEFLQQHTQEGMSPLCGNSVWQDRLFLQKYMPTLEAFLHYRVIDVSSVKEIVRRWYPQDKQRHFEKKEGHRALDDIRASCEELKHLRTYFFKELPAK
jgi:oligoribonuclease